MSSFGRRSHLRSALTLGILVTAANCTICNCEEPPRDPDCVRARADVMGDHWPEGVMLTLFVDDLLVASADCSDLPGDGDTRECSVDTEFEILLNEVVLSSASAGASIEINVDGLDGQAGSLRLEVDLPDGSTDSFEASFEDVRVDDGPLNPESCPNRLCRQANAYLEWDGPSP